MSCLCSKERPGPDRAKDDVWSRRGTEKIIKRPVDGYEQEHQQQIHLPATDTSSSRRYISSSRYIFQQLLHLPAARDFRRGEGKEQEPVPMVHEVQASLELLRLTLRNHVSPTQVEMEVVG